ncbi:hypothetical protein ONR57_01160 [Hoyosella sp. YIM 151337]|uniref:hypothetical protein n=1 Tax=Hoyosella sp. YIM 151337 TaxID=2992742 RepID=UPI0022360B4C|nr:hypothetical protein [Hoyosella sp. YIM 151337]MCW4351908.1 hypothetical protein [Hoyosella sp. YIM 151337]
MISTAAAVAPNSGSVGEQGAEVSFAKLIDAARDIWTQTFEGDIDEGSAVLLALAATVFSGDGDNGAQELATRLSSIVAAISAPDGADPETAKRTETAGEERKAIVLRLFEERLCSAAARRQQATGAPAAELPRYSRAAASM